MQAQTNIQFDEWETLVEQLREAKKESAELEKLIQGIQSRLSELCGDEPMVERDGLKVQIVSSRGTVQWRRVPEVARLSENYLDSFRGPGRSYRKFSFYA